MSKVDFSQFTDRELSLIKNCVQYAKSNPAGLPGHNLMVIIDKLVSQHDGAYIDEIDALLSND